MCLKFSQNTKELQNCSCMLKIIVWEKYNNYLCHFLLTLHYTEYNKTILHGFNIDIYSIKKKINTILKI